MIVQKAKIDDPEQIRFERCDTGDDRVIYFLQLRHGAEPPGRFDFLTRDAAEKLRDALVETLGAPKEGKE